MPTKQQEFYTQLRTETESKVVTYQDFQKQIDHKKEEIKTLKSDQKFLAKLIASNNAKLKAQGLDEVKLNT